MSDAEEGALTIVVPASISTMSTVTYPVESVVPHAIHRAMPSGERRDRLVKVFTSLRGTAEEFTSTQENMLYAAMEVRTPDE